MSIQSPVCWSLESDSKANVAGTSKTQSTYLTRRRSLSVHSAFFYAFIVHISLFFCTLFGIHYILLSNSFWCNWFFVRVSDQHESLCYLGHWAHLILDINLLLTEREDRTGEYWLEIVAVRTQRSDVRTKTSKGQFSPVRLERARWVNSLL